MRELIGGIETCNDPFEGRSVELPAGYLRYWVSPQGQYLLSEDLSYDPRQGSTLDFREMQRHRP